MNFKDIQTDISLNSMKSLDLYKTCLTGLWSPTTVFNQGYTSHLDVVLAKKDKARFSYYL